MAGRIPRRRRAVHRQPQDEQQADTKQHPVLDETGFQDLHRVSRKVVRQPANVLFHPDGRIQINSEAIEWLWPESPHKDRSGEPTVPGPLRVRLFAKWPKGRNRAAEQLVVVAADLEDPNALVASPVGRREVRWPVVYVVRAAQFMRELGIYGHVRYEADKVFFRLQSGRQARALRVDLRKPVEGRADDILECLREWKAQAQPGEPVKRDEFLKQLAEVARRLGTVITRRQLEDYVRSHKNQIRQLGIRFVLSGKTTFREVLVEPQPEGQAAETAQEDQDHSAAP